MQNSISLISESSSCIIINGQTFNEGDPIDTNNPNFQILKDSGFIVEKDENVSNRSGSMAIGVGAFSNRQSSVKEFDVILESAKEPETRTISGTMAIGVGGFGGFNRCKR